MKNLPVIILSLAVVALGVVVAWDHFGLKPASPAPTSVRTDVPTPPPPVDPEPPQTSPESQSQDDAVQAQKRSLDDLQIFDKMVKKGLEAQNTQMLEALTHTAADLAKNMLKSAARLPGDQLRAELTPEEITGYRNAIAAMPDELEHLRKRCAKYYDRRFKFRMLRDGFMPPGFETRTDEGAKLTRGVFLSDETVTTPGFSPVGDQLLFLPLSWDGIGERSHAPQALQRLDDRFLRNEAKNADLLLIIDLYTKMELMHEWTSAAHEFLTHTVETNRPQLVATITGHVEDWFLKAHTSRFGADPNPVADEKLNWKMWKELGYPPNHPWQEPPPNEAITQIFADNDIAPTQVRKDILTFIYTQALARGGDDA